MAWGDQFNKHFHLAQARTAYETLADDQKLIIDAAIIKKLSRDAYEAALRIYEMRGIKKITELFEIFDHIILDYTDPDRISILRGCMIGLESEEDKTLYAREELANNEDYYQSVMLSEYQARYLAGNGICIESFNSVRSQLMPMAPVVLYMLRTATV